MGGSNLYMLKYFYMEESKDQSSDNWLLRWKEKTGVTQLHNHSPGRVHWGCVGRCPGTISHYTEYITLNGLSELGREKDKRPVDTSDIWLTDSWRHLGADRSP